MAVLHKTKGIDLADEIRFNRRTWTFERAGWVFLALLVGAALAGATGPGLLSSVTRRDANGSLELAFERFPHFRTDSSLTATIPLPAEGDHFELWIDQSLRDRVEVKRVDPVPLRVTVDHGRVIYAFQKSREAGPRTVVFHTVPEAVGPVRGRVCLGPGGGIDLFQFVFP